MRALPRLALVPIAALLVVGACASGDGTSTNSEPEASASTSAPKPMRTPEPFRGLPEGAGRDIQSPAGVVIGDDGLIQVVTFGSSSNPAIVRGATAEGQTVTVDVRNVPDRPATMDFQPTTSAFFLPEDVDPAKPITFVLGDLGTVVAQELEPRMEVWVEPRD